MKGGGLRVTYAAEQEPGFAPPKPRRPAPGSKGDGAEIISGCLPGQAVGLPALRLGKPCARVGIEWREMAKSGEKLREVAGDGRKLCELAGNGGKWREMVASLSWGDLI